MSKISDEAVMHYVTQFIEKSLSDVVLRKWEDVSVRRVKLNSKVQGDRVRGTISYSVSCSSGSRSGTVEVLMKVVE